MKGPRKLQFGIDHLDYKDNADGLCKYCPEISIGLAGEQLTKEELHSLRSLLDLAVSNAPTIGCSKEWWMTIRRKVSAVLTIPACDHAHLIGHDWH